MATDFITGQIKGALASFQGNESGNAPTLLMLGGFKFSLNTAVFQQMERGTSWRWAAQERVGQLDALQCTGPGEDRVTLPGVIYPEFRGGLGQLDDLRRLAGEMKPVRLLNGAGGVLGMWVIEKVEETASGFSPQGTPRKQEFIVSLRKFSNGKL